MPKESDADPVETREWVDAIESVIANEGVERAQYLLENLIDRMRQAGADLPFSATTAYVNTIPVSAQPQRPPDFKVEGRVSALTRWNAMALVVRANKESSELGGHVASYASAATLYDIGFNHFWHAPSEKHGGDLVYLQGHSSPGFYARAFLEGRLSVETPDWLWVATGMRALDHAVEAIYSIRHQMLTDTLAAKAIALLIEHLPASIKTKGEQSLDHRGNCQMAAWFSIFGGMNTRFGVSHAMGHQIGPKWDVPHGVTSCITMPHVMRFMADIAPQRFGPIAEGLGVKFDPSNARPAALECADRVQTFIAKFDVPHTLKDAGVKRSEIPEIAEPVHSEIEHAKVVDRPVNREEIVALLEAAYQ